jgi:hypothetical protein
MNCTNQNTELSPLKIRCNRLRIYVSGHNPTPAEIIPIIEQRLADHRHDPARTAGPWSGDFIEWKLIHDEYHEFLADLRKLSAPPAPAGSENPSPAFTPTLPQNSSTKNSPQCDSTVANQQSTADSKLIPGDSKVIPGDSEVIPDDPTFTSSDSDSLKPEPHFPQPSQAGSPTGSKHQTPSEPFDINKYLSSDEIQASLDLQGYLSGRSPLDDLPSQQQQAIILLLEDHPAWRVAKVLAQPEPHGLSFKVAPVTLNRFKKRFAIAKDACRKAQNQKAIDDLLSKANDTEETFQTAIQRLIKIRLITTTSEPNANLDTMDLLITSLTKLRKQTLAERKQLHVEKTKPPAQK